MQRRTLIRARGLAGFRSALVELAIAGGPRAARRRNVVVPTRAAAELLRQTIEAGAWRAGRAAVILPDLVTRDEWVAQLHAALPGAPRWMSRVEREVLFERSARMTAARAGMAGGPFPLRPGLVAVMLDFYDELQRRQRTVRRFARALFDELRVERGTDRGSEGLIHQTAFLGFAFLAYERAVAAAGAVDEHALRRALLAEQPRLPFDHVVVGVADHPADPRGLWPADFDLLGRLTGVAAIDVVLTDESHDAGFRDRLERELPGISERRADDGGAVPCIETPDEPAEARVFVSRDREEELRDVARVIRARAAETDHVLRESAAVVFHRPLPYLYLAHQVLADAQVPYQAFDALPLGGEPYAALLDLVVAVARTGGTREASIALLRSAQLSGGDAGAAIDLDDVAALDELLAERRSIGSADTYLDEVDSWLARHPRRVEEAARARRAAAAAAAAAAALAPFRDADRASVQIGTLASFLRARERGPAADDPWRDRHRRARAAILGVLDNLSAAFARHDNHRREPEDLLARLHHAIEAQTFTPRRGRDGVHLVDSVGARFGEFDHVHLVGLVETDWPERPRRSILFTGTLLKSLGWPQDTDQSRAQQAAFRDLLGLAAKTVRLHAFQLEGDSIVALSPMADAARTLPAHPVPPPPDRRVFADEVLTIEDITIAGLEAEPSAWLGLRRRRPDLSVPRYSGFVAPLPPARYRVSKVDRYVDCPFKYFAESVLGLPEEREEMSGLTPLERGTLLHELFERFYRRWHDERRGAITAESLPDAMAMFSALTHEALAMLPPADRALEEARLLGSIVARGVAERVFELEVDAGGDIVDRRLEQDLRGPFAFPLTYGLASRTIEIIGKADRIDIFRNGSLRVIDYKLGRMPDLERSLQAAVYAHCAQQTLEREDGRPHLVDAAMYLAFGEDRQLDGKLGKGGEPAAMAVQRRASEFAMAVDHIEAGEFPPQPARQQDCSWCRYAGVCRKEYRIDDDHEEGPGDETADPV